MASAIGDLVINFLGNTSGLDKALSASQNRVTKFVSDVRGSLMSMSGLGGVLTGAGLIAGVKMSLDAATQAIQAEKKLAAVITATGGAAGFTTRQLVEEAAALQKVTNYDDEATMNAMAVLATFTQVRGDIFKDAIRAAQDLSSVLEKDLQTSVVQIGKALTDPALGMAGLRKFGAVFTDQQTAQIEALQKAGRLVEAQRAILGALAGKYGGSAEALADPIVQLKNAAGDLAEEVGKKLLPYIKALAASLKDDLNATTAIKALGEAVGWLADRFADAWYYASKLSAWNMRASKERLETGWEMGFTFTMEQWQAMQQERADLLREINTKLPKLEADIAAMDAARAKGSFSERLRRTEAEQEAKRGTAGAFPTALPLAAPSSAITDAFTQSVQSAQEHLRSLWFQVGQVGDVWKGFYERMAKGVPEEARNQLAALVIALAKTQEQIDQKGPTDDLWERLSRIKGMLDKLGVKPEAIDGMLQLADATKQMQLTLEAEGVRKSLLTPLDQYRNEITRLKQLVERGGLKPEEAFGAAKAAKASLAGPILDAIKTPAERFQDAVEDARTKLKAGIITPQQYEQFVSKTGAQYREGLLPKTPQQEFATRMAEARDLFRAGVLSPEELASVKGDAINRAMQAAQPQERPTAAGAFEMGSREAWSAIMEAMGAAERGDEKALLRQQLQKQDKANELAAQQLEEQRKSTNAIFEYNPFENG